MSTPNTGVAEEVEAGRETDALVAELVMGWPVVEADTPIAKLTGYVYDGVPTWRMGRRPWSQAVFRPSDDIADAWVVVEKLRVDGGDWNYVVKVEVGERAFAEATTADGGHVASAYADTVPLAICRMAIKATPSQPEQQISTPTPPRKP